MYCCFYSILRTVFPTEYKQDRNMRHKNVPFPFEENGVYLDIEVNTHEISNS